MLNEEAFSRICKACDELILRSHLVVIKSIPWLHPVREHPFFLRQYDGLLTAPVGAFCFDWFIRLTRSLLGWGKQIFRALFIDRLGLVFSRQRSGKYDLILVSHLLREEQLHGQADMYFGNIKAQLEAKGIRVLVALIDHTPAAYFSLPLRGKTELPDDHVLLCSSMSVFPEIRHLAMVLWGAISLFLISFSRKTELERKICRRAAVEVLGGGTRATLRIARQLGSLVRVVQPHLLVTTYEGHPWERISIAYARIEKPGLLCAAYQHGNLFRLQHALRRGLGKIYDPDYILCSGAVAYEDLKRTINMPNVELFNIGSPRATEPIPCDNLTPSASRQMTCLVVPDGIEEEIAFLFKFSVDAAKKLPSMKFILRLHPANDWADLVRKYPFLGDLPSNISFSTDTLQRDAGNSAWVLYRGSSAVLAAVAGGAIPLYLAREGEMIIDPLYGYEGYRFNVECPDDLSEIVVHSQLGDHSDYCHERLARYCQDIYTPYNTKPIVDILGPTMQKIGD